MGAQETLTSFHRDIGISINFQEESSLVSFWSLELHRPLEVSSDVRLPVQMRMGTGVSSRISTQDWDINSSCDMNTSLNLRHCREILPSFESGSLAVHSTWDRKHRVPLTYLLLRENSTWGAGGNLAQIFNQRQGISSHLGTIWRASSFPQVPVLILIFISTWEGCLRESLSIPQGSQATCTAYCGTRDSYGANDG